MLSLPAPQSEFSLSWNLRDSQEICLPHLQKALVNPFHRNVSTKPSLYPLSPLPVPFARDCLISSTLAGLLPSSASPQWEGSF